MLFVLLLLALSRAEGHGKKAAGGKGKNVRRANSLKINLPYGLFYENSRNWRVSAPATSEALMDKGGGYAKVSRAQDKEDMWLYENWFYGKEGGVILESGALDGVMYSNSYLFEKWAKWMPIHVEADPRNYIKLVRNREKSVNINAALCGEPKVLHYTNDDGGQIQGELQQILIIWCPDATLNLSSFYYFCPGFVEFMSPSFIRKWHKGIHKGTTKIEDLPTVQCVQMKKLMPEINVKHIDIWVLGLHVILALLRLHHEFKFAYFVPDVEGAEQSVLEGTDFDALDISVIAMECDHHDEEKNQKKRDILEANGFECQEVERNCFCKHVSFVPSTMPAEKQLYPSYRDATGPKIH